MKILVYSFHAFDEKKYFDRLPDKRGRELSKMTVGVIGTGRIGRTVLKQLSGFGCRLLGYDRYPNSEAARCARCWI